MIVQVTGDRNWSDYMAIAMAFASLPNGEEVQLIHGDAHGADRMCGEFAQECCGWEVFPVPARWDLHGRAAGPIRNRKMLDYNPAVLLGFHDDIKSSKGTKDCIKEAVKRGIPTILFTTYRGKPTNYTLLSDVLAADL